MDNTVLKTMRKNYFLIILFLFSLISMLWLFKDFIKIAAIAWLLVMITQNFAVVVESKLTSAKTKLIAENAALINATLLTTALVLILFLPLVYIVSYVISNLNFHAILGLKASIISNISSFSWLSSGIKDKIISTVNDYLNDFDSQENIKHMLSMAQGYLTNFSKGVLDLGTLVTLFFLFHWFRRNMIDFTVALIPLEIKQQRQLYRNVSGAISIVFLTIFFVAVTQGIAFGILMAFFHYNPLVMGFFIAIASIIPVVGAALVWVPVAINEVVHGNITAAIIITCYGCAVLAFLIDNFIRLIFLNYISNIVKVDYKINEFLLFFAIAAGISTIGFFGILIGPAIVALFVAVAKTLVADK